MRTLWRAIVRVLFWSYERGTRQYDLAVAGIVLFVLFSPVRSLQTMPTSPEDWAASTESLEAASAAEPGPPPKL